MYKASNLSQTKLSEMFSCIKIIRLDKGFHSALSLYLGNGIKKDMEMVVNGETVLEEMQKLLATTSMNLIG